MALTLPTPARTLAAAALVAFASLGLSERADAQTGASDWSGQVTLYGWGAGIGGDVTPFTGAPTLSFDKSLSEVLEDLDGAFFATGLVRRGDFVVVGDFTYSASSREGLVPPGVPAAGEVDITSVTLAAGQRFRPAAGTTVDLLGGFRHWRLNGLVEVPLAGVRAEREVTFTDPILALRVNTEVAPRWSLIGYADVGGFGVGSESTWQGVVTANYQATDNLYLSAGWRHLYLDYRDGGTRFEGYLSGPLVGVTWRF